MPFSAAIIVGIVTSAKTALNHSHRSIILIDSLNAKATPCACRGFHYFKRFSSPHSVFRNAICFLNAPLSSQNKNKSYILVKLSPLSKTAIDFWNYCLSNDPLAECITSMYSLGLFLLYFILQTKSAQDTANADIISNGVEFNNHHWIIVQYPPHTIRLLQMIYTCCAFCAKFAAL